MWGADNTLFDRSQVFSNSGENGGAVCSRGGDNVVFSSCIMNNNEARGDGGGAVRLMQGGDLTLENCLVSNNYSNNSGGGIDAGTGSELVLHNTIVVGNEALGGGGGIHSSSGSVTAFNSVIAGNRAGGDGGGIDPAFSDLILVNTVISENYASYVSGGGISGAWDASISTCNVFGNTPDNYGTYPDPTGTNGNISVDPLFLDTTAPDSLDWDLHLDPLSPLVDVGDATLLDPDGYRSDMGAYGGPGAELWDLDWDGFPSWWQPGAYDYTDYPDDGWDCEDMDETVYPGNGC